MTGYKVEIRNYPDAEITDYIIEETYYFLNKHKAIEKLGELTREYNYDYDTDELLDQEEYQVALEEINIIE